MHELAGEMVLMRVHIGESDRYEESPDDWTTDITGSWKVFNGKPER
jgi:hypothetical protein